MSTLSKAPAANGKPLGLNKALELMRRPGTRQRRPHERH
jgi:hypothetical protein